MANPVGRPSGYNEETQARADDYIRASGEELREAIPSAAGLACYLGVSKRTIYNWADNYPKLLHTLENINTAQEQKAVNGGMVGVFNSTITKLVLANHGYSDKQEVDHSSKDGSMTPPAPTYTIVNE